MAQIPRPPKQGSVTTYQAKVAAGYTKILASEMDADLDTIYGAWNGGADTVNLRDGCVTSVKLAADAVGPREIADGGIFTVALADGAVTTPKLANAAVTDPKIVSVSWGKVTGVPVSPTTYPPSGPATNDLSGSYPGPAIRDLAVTTLKLADGAVTTLKLGPGAVTGAALAPGAVDTPLLSLDAATQFGEGGGTPLSVPIAISDKTERVLHSHSASVPSRGGLIFVIGMFSGQFVSAQAQGILARLRVGGSAGLVADGIQLAQSQAHGGEPSGAAAFPFQLSCIGLFRPGAGATGPFKLTAQLLGAAVSAADIYDVQCIAWEFA